MSKISSFYRLHYAHDEQILSETRCSTMCIGGPRKRYLHAPKQTGNTARGQRPVKNIQEKSILQLSYISNAQQWYARAAQFMSDKLVAVTCWTLAVGKRTCVVVGHGNPVELLGSEQSKTLPSADVYEVLEEPTTETKSKAQFFCCWEYDITNKYKCLYHHSS